MKLSTQSHNSIVSAIQEALGNYSLNKEENQVTDFYLQPDCQSGKLVLFDDEEVELTCVIVDEWVDANPEDFYADAELSLKKVLNRLREMGVLENMKVLKPYSFVLVDQEKETIADLLLVDDEETLFLNDELLKGLDDELNAFLKDLMEE
jgi:glutamine synthetase